MLVFKFLPILASLSLCCRKPIPVKINIINLGSSVFQRGEYAHKSRLLGTKSDPITESMKKLQNSER